MAMKLLRGVAISVVVFGTMITAASCGKTVDGTDSNTHWLDECDSDSDCGNLSCLCGVCSSECSDEASCAEFGSAAVCAGACSTITKTFCVRGTQGTGGQSASGGAANTGGTRASGGAGGGSAGSGGRGDVPDGPAPGPCEVRTTYPCGSGEFPSGYYWDGRTCVNSGCCFGSDCPERYFTAAGCDEAHAACYENDGIALSCTTNADCILTTRACCFCGETTVNDVIAIRGDSEPGWTKASCAENQGACPPCVPIENELLSAICFEGECKVLDVQWVDSCDRDEDCTLQPKSCCNTCGQTRDDFAAVSIDDTYLLSFRQQVCGANEDAICDAIACAPPETLEARCLDGCRIVEKALP